jgi:hypothetical protein
MRIDSSGNVGIGTSSPANKLDVKGSATDFVGISSTNTNSSGATTATSALRLGITNTVREVFTSIKTVEEGVDENKTALVFSTTNIGAILTEVARIDSSGNVGIGTSSPGSKLTVIGTSTVGNFSASGNATSATVQIQAANGDGYDARLYFECPGVNSGGLTYQRANARLYAYSQSEFSGPYVSALGTSWTTGSDIRLKTNIQDITYGLASVMALSPKKYAYINNAEKQCFGLIAQDVIDVIPEVVDAPQDASAMMGIEYQALIPVLVKAIQEQQALITALTTRITALESK